MADHSEETEEKSRACSHLHRTYNPFLCIPDATLAIILAFAAPPTERAHLLCHRLASTCVAMHVSVESGLHDTWSAILADDYGGANRGNDGGRRSKRLRHSPKSAVEASHRLVLDRTAVAHFAITEMAHSSRTSLSVARLRWCLREYGPNIRINHRVEIGGTFLVEICRARNVTERVVLACVRELVEYHGANVNLAAAPETRARRFRGASMMSSSQLEVEGGLTPLCIASARGMPSVVKYLLCVGASPQVAGTGRFRLFTKSTKSISGTFRPIQFSQAMKEAEIAHGAKESVLTDLNKCIKLLRTNMEGAANSLALSHH